MEHNENMSKAEEIFATLKKCDDIKNLDMTINDDTSVITAQLKDFKHSIVVGSNDEIRCSICSKKLHPKENVMNALYCVLNYCNEYLLKLGRAYYNSTLEVVVLEYGMLGTFINDIGLNIMLLMAQLQEEFETKLGLVHKVIKGNLSYIVRELELMTSLKASQDAVIDIQRDIIAAYRSSRGEDDDNDDFDQILYGEDEPDEEFKELLSNIKNSSEGSSDD